MAGRSRTCAASGMLYALTDVDIVQVMELPLETKIWMKVEGDCLVSEKYNVDNPSQELIDLENMLG
jgi:hypothetical protein